MDLVAFIPQSSTHWPGCKASVIFTPGCNYRCGHCPNYPLVLFGNKLPKMDLNKFIEQFAMDYHKGKVNAVVITGGEPTLQGNKLFYFLEELKENDVPVRINTNGSRPEILKELINAELVDYLAVELKNRLEEKDYSQVAGRQVNLSAIKESIELIKNSRIEYEFSLTFVPGLHSKENVRELVSSLGLVKKFVLRQFNPASGTLDKSFEAKGLGSYDDLLAIAKELPLNAQEIRISSVKGEESIQPITVKLK